MGLTKTELFTDQQNHIARMVKALGHPARIAIVEYLLKANACVNGTLVDELGLAQPTISQHLRELKEVGIVQGTIEGTSVSYCINATVWKELQNTLNHLFNLYTPKTNCC